MPSQVRASGRPFVSCSVTKHDVCIDAHACILLLLGPTFVRATAPADPRTLLLKFHTTRSKRAGFSIRNGTQTSSSARWMQRYAMAEQNRPQLPEFHPACGAKPSVPCMPHEAQDAWEATAKKNRSAELPSLLMTKS